jgi:CheY-like chemotaxis protein
VDDDLDAGNMLKQLLEFRGHHVTVIDEGSRCITHCNLFRYNIIFMDYHMQGLDGAQVTDIVKKNNLDCFDCPTLIFAYTGDNSKKAIETFRKVGMDGVIIKTVSVADFEILVMNLEWRLKLDKKINEYITKKTKGEIIFF